MKHTTWFDTLGAPSVRKAAEQSGMKQRTLAAQLEKNALPAETVIRLAKAYGRHPVTALIETEYLTKKDGESISPAEALKLATDEELADEVLARLKRGGSHPDFTDPADVVDRRRTQAKIHIVKDPTPDTLREELTNAAAYNDTIENSGLDHSHPGYNEP